jgi:hypothetical protein
VESLLKPLLKKVTPVVDSRMLCLSKYLVVIEKHFTQKNPQIIICGIKILMGLFPIFSRIPSHQNMYYLNIV